MTEKIYAFATYIVLPVASKIRNELLNQQHEQEHGKGCARVLRQVTASSKLL